MAPPGNQAATENTNLDLNLRDSKLLAARNGGIYFKQTVTSRSGVIAVVLPEKNLTLRSHGGYVLRRMFSALTLSPLPFLVLSAHFRLLAIVISVFTVCMCLWGKAHHFATFLRLSFTAFLGCFGLTALAAPSGGRAGHWELVSQAVIGALCGMILGYFWVENYYDRRLFNARIAMDKADRSDFREPKYEWAGHAVLLLFVLLSLVVLLIPAVNL